MTLQTYHSFDDYMNKKTVEVALAIAAWKGVYGTSADKRGELNTKGETPIGRVARLIYDRDGDQLFRDETSTEPYLPFWRPDIPAHFLPGMWSFERADCDGKKLVKWTNETYRLGLARVTAFKGCDHEA